jgi:predicted nucleic acid-binding Zn ribbon protein
MADALESALGGLETSTKIRESLALAYWDRVVGPQAAAASEAESVREGTLFVRTRSSVWSHELTFLQSHIVAELNRRVGRPVIREIVFRAQGVRMREPAKPAPIKPSEEELAAVVLSPQERQRVDRALEELGAIRSESVRIAVSRRIVRERRLRAWRLEHGWRPCRDCNSLHPAEDSICPMCRAEGLKRAR